MSQQILGGAWDSASPTSFQVLPVWTTDHTSEYKILDSVILGQHLKGIPPGSSRLHWDAQAPLFLLLPMTHISVLVTRKRILLPGLSAFGRCVPSQQEIVFTIYNSQFTIHNLSFWAGLLSPSLTLITFQVTDTGWEAATGQALPLGPCSSPCSFIPRGSWKHYAFTRSPLSHPLLLSATSPGKCSWILPGRVACTLLCAPKASRKDLFYFVHLPVSIPQIYPPHCELKGPAKCLVIPSIDPSLSPLSKLMQ